MRHSTERINLIEQLSHDLKGFYQLCRHNRNLRIWEAPDTRTSAFVFPVQLVNGWTISDAFKILSEKQIEIRTLMGGVCNEQQAFRGILNGEILENAHRMAETTFFVGIHQTLQKESIQHVGAELAEIGKMPK